MELDLRILQNETNFKDVEKEIFRIVCKQAQETLKKLLEKIDQACFCQVKFDPFIN